MTHPGRLATLAGAGLVGAALALSVVPAASAASDFPLIKYPGGERTVNAWETVRIAGTVRGLAPGTTMCLYRAEEGDTDARGVRLKICTVVNKDRTFRMRAQLGVRGTYYYQLFPVPFQRVNQGGLLITVR